VPFYHPLLLGIPYAREEDLENLKEDLHSLFDHLKHEDGKEETYEFLEFFTDNYIHEYWLNGPFEKSEISFWKDLSHFSSDHMTNNAIESWNNEMYNLLGRQAHPNPYTWMEQIGRAFYITEENLKDVDRGDYNEIRSSLAKKVIEKRAKLKQLYMERISRAGSAIELQQAKLKYLIAAGYTNAGLRGKRKKSTNRKGPVSGGRRGGTGRPAYKRMKAPDGKDCQFCGKSYKTRAGCKGHEKRCLQAQSEASQKSGSDRGTIRGRGRGGRYEADLPDLRSGSTSSLVLLIVQ
jgi:hypothetical protein